MDIKKYQVLKHKAEQGDVSAQYDLGIMLEYCGTSEALSWLSKAAEQGHLKAQCNLGRICYRIGKRYNKEDYFYKAFYWFRKAAESNDPQALNGLGKCYLHGYGVQNDNTEAVRLFRVAAQKNDLEALCNLGKCFLYGLGVAQNIEEAKRLLFLAAEQDQTDALYELGESFLYGSNYGMGVKRNIDEAKKCFLLAARKGNYLAEEKLKKVFKI